MRFELRHIRAFLAVAEELQFRLAAERLHMTQPALSRTIQLLEEAVGAKLLSRTTRSVQLTEAGRAFQKETALALDHIKQAVRTAQSAEQGNIGYLRIAYMDFAINGSLPNLIEKFHAEYPGIRIDLFHMPTSEQKEALLKSTIDVGFLIGPFIAPNIKSITLIKEKMVVLLPSLHPLAKKKSIAMEDLSLEPFVIGSVEGWAAFRSHFFTMCHRAGFTPSITQEASTSDGIFGLVAANTGISIYPSCVRNIHRSGVVLRPLSNKNSELETQICWESGSNSPSKEIFTQFLLNSLLKKSAR